MAKEWAKELYNSNLWKDARLAALKRDRYICQTPGCYRPAEEVHHIIKLTKQNIGDPMISLNQDNLTSLCGDCHKARHRRDKIEGIRSRAKYQQQNILPEVEFDGEGYPIEVAKKPPGGDG